MNLNEMVSAASELREQKRSLDRAAKDIAAELETLNLKILTSMDELGIDRLAVGGITMSVSEQVVPNVVDWPAFERYVIENNALHLLQRRAATSAYRELLQAGETPAGVEPFTKRNVNMRVQ